MLKLFIVPTPIGNLKDITLRALEILKEANYIVCEDTRRTKILLDHYDIQNKKLISYFAPREEEKLPLIMKILEKENVALVVDAGMPAISDPGYKLIKACLDKGIKVEVLPGPSAFLTALIGSGFQTDKFLFLGFLPKKGLENYLSQFKDLDVTIIFYESSKRILKTLKIINKIFGECQIVIAREISKIYEEYIRGDIDKIIKILENKKIKGEITVILRKKMDSKMTIDNKKTILIIDDEKDFREILMIKLEKSGFNVYEASNAEEGFVLLEKINPDIILVDLVMPKMNGLDTIFKIKVEKKINAHCFLMSNKVNFENDKILYESYKKIVSKFGGLDIIDKTKNLDTIINQILVE